MRQLYFTSENITEKSREFLDKYKNTRNIEFIVKKSALIVTDMQNYFFDDNSHAFIPSAPAIIPNIQKLLEAYSKTNLPIIFTRHINTKENAELMGTWWRDTIRKESFLSEIIQELDCSNALIIEKTQYDSFYKTSLEDILKDKEIKQLVITGIMMHLCCETTARSAFVRGFEPFIAVDGTATYNEEFHKASLLNLAHGFAMPVLTKDILEKING